MRKHTTSFFCPIFSVHYIPEGILFDKKFKKLREYIYRNSYVQDIISLPSGSFKPYTEVKTSILYLTKVNKNKKLQKSVWHYTVKNDGYTLNNRRQKKAEENDLDLFLSAHNSNNESNLLNLGFTKLNMEEVINNNYVSMPNPYKRFEYNSLFKTLQLSELIEEVTIYNTVNAAVWSVTNKNGGSFIVQNEVFKEKVASDNTGNYKLVKHNHFAYSPPRINVGSIALNLSEQIGCVSPIYVVFKVKDETKLNPKYLYKLLQSQQFKNQINNFAFGSVRQTVNFDDFCKITIPLPNIDEQQKIVEELDSYQKIIDGAKQAINSWSPFFEIDKNWEVVKIGDVCNNKAQYGLSQDMNTENDGYKILRMGNLQKGFLDFTDIKYVKINKEVFMQFKLNKGDILFNRTNSFELVGKTSIFESDEEYCFASYLIRIVVNQKKILPKFLNLFMNTDVFQKNLKNYAKQSNNQANINAQILLAQKILLPSLLIQEEIIAELEHERNMIEANKETIKLFENKLKTKLDSLWQC